MLAIYDADILVFRTACAYENEELDLAIWNINNQIERINDTLQADDCVFYLTGKDNFRKQIYPDYKGQRPKERPSHWQALRDHLVDARGAQVINGREADDDCGIALTKNGIFSTCISIDKDLLQVPGNHYNYVKDEHIVINELRGWYNFYTQVLIGDTIDNCPGAKGIGKAKARKILEATDGSKEQMFQVCQETYKAVGHTEEYFNQMCECLFILREEGRFWKSPN